jgi:hypothetical protein
VATQGNSWSGELHEDAVIAQMVPDPGNVPSLVGFSGFLGRSTDKDHWRLYFTLDLNSYVDVPAREIVRHVQLSPGESTLGSTILWMKRTAKLRYRVDVGSEAESWFVAGDVTAEYLRSAGGKWPRTGSEGAHIDTTTFCHPPGTQGGRGWP